jgi:hypothetical protein
MHNAVKSREKLPEHISDFTLINRPRPKPMKTRRRAQKCLNQNIKQQLAWRCASLVATYVLYKPSHTFFCCLLYTTFHSYLFQKLALCANMVWRPEIVHLPLYEKGWELHGVSEPKLRD